MRFLLPVPALLLALARPAAADPDEAERLKAAAEQAVRAGDAVKAVYYLRRAYEAHPDPGLIANLGLVYERLGQYGDAADSFERYLASDPPEAKRIAAEAALARLRPEGVITSTPPGATVQLDDAPESVGNTPLRLRLTAGAHAARLTYFGYAPADAPIEVKPGQPFQLDATLVALPTAPPPPVEHEGRFTLGIVAVGAGAVALAIGGVFGALTASAVAERDAATSFAAFDSAEARANTSLAVTISAGTTGLLALGLGTWLLATRDQPLVFAPTPNGAAVVGAF